MNLRKILERRKEIKIIRKSLRELAVNQKAMRDGFTEYHVIAVK